MELFLDRSSKEPNYLQIENQIKNQVYQGKLKPSDQLPSIRSLARQLNVAIITVKRAYDDLEQEGIIQTIPGKGCFIRSFPLHQLEQQLEIEFKRKLETLILSARQRGLKKDQIEEILRKILDQKEE